MNSTDIYKSFNDPRFNGVEKISNSGIENFNTTNKFIRICKDFYFTQDVYAKSLMKINTNISQLSNDKCDCLNPMLSFFSVTFCVFTNVQIEFGLALNKIIKSLNYACDNDKDGIFKKTFSSRQLSVINEFKNAETQLNKSKQKYFSLCHSNSSSISSDNEKSVKRAKELYQNSIVAYNKARTNFLEVLSDGFVKSKEHHLAHLNNMRQITKSFGNAMAKLVFDMKDSVDSIKQYYKSYNKDEIFQSWVEANKTVFDPTKESFPEAVMEFPERTISNEFHENGNLPSLPIQNPVLSEKETKKPIQLRKMSHNIASTGFNLNDQDIPDSASQDSNGAEKQNSEKINVSQMKSGKKKWGIFSSIMKFKSTSNLADDDNIVKNDIDTVDNWQSRNNLNDSVLVDDEGFIIRGTGDEGNKRLSQSSASSESSYGKRMKGLRKLNIKPLNELSKIPDTNSELMSVAIQLPLPIRERTKIDVSKRISNLQRSSKPVTYVTKDKLYRRSMSVSELQHLRHELDSPEQNGEVEILPMPPEGIAMPIACVDVEIITSEGTANSCSILGQITVAFPIALKHFLEVTPENQLPPTIEFKFVDHSHQIRSAQITNQLQDIARLERLDKKTYIVSIILDYLKKILIGDDNSARKFEVSNRITLPIIEYTAQIRENLQNVIDCQARWAMTQMPNVQFDFILSSVLFKDNKPTIVKLKLLTEGIIEDVFSKDNLTVDKLNGQCWKINYEKSDNRISVIIRTFNRKNVKLKMHYEFTYEKFSLVKPELTLIHNTNTCDNLNFKISLMHHRTISTGNFCQLFEYNIV